MSVVVRDEVVILGVPGMKEENGYQHKGIRKENVV
jgi:hypothetical protein